MRNKERGKDLERKVVARAMAEGIRAKRTWGSTGTSIGLPADVDVVVSEKYYLQCKKSKRLRKDLLPDKDHLHGVVIEAERTDTYIVIRLTDYLDYLNLKMVTKVQP